ncbi:MAG: isopeptide-forming domain-containing fimbrial protein [Lachnospiraceae bacterium]|nr:isopeptide-forming domain-containing fimbrial protein [Lachnospiraceae bacterium]
MKKSLRRACSWLMAMVMVLSMALSANAATTTTPPSGWPTTISETLTVEGLETGLTVYGYKIVEAVWDDNDNLIYQQVETLQKSVYDTTTQTYVDAIADVTAPTSDEITAIAAKIIAKTVTLDKITFTESTTDPDIYTADVTVAGTWLVIVQGSENVSTVYNPMIVSAYYTYDDSGTQVKIESGSDAVSAKGNWNIASAASSAYAKSSTTTFEKTIVGSGSGNDHGDDVAIGDLITYQIKTNFPTYDPTYYKDVVFTITDQMDTSLSYAEGNHLTITVGGNDVTDEDAYVTVTAPKANEAGGTLIADFDSDFVLANPGAEVIITFQARLNETAGINYDPNVNKASYKYTNGYDENGDATYYEDDDETYHYTFGIDATLSGSTSGSWSEYTHELIKVAADQWEKTSLTETVSGRWEYNTSLEGAGFQLLADDKTTVVADAVSDEYGNLSFTGLDAGIYYLQETSAPVGYAVDSTLHEVKISATYNDDKTSDEYGTLTSYSITIDGDTTSTYTATYKSKEDGTHEVIVKDVTVVTDPTTALMNYKMGALPSTGGIGATIFTIVGCVVMVGAAGLFFATRRRRQAKRS